MRFLSLILLLSLPCTISIHAMKSGEETVQKENKIIFYSEQDYNKKLSIIEAVMCNKLHVSDITSNKITLPDFTNPSIKHELPLLEIKQEIQELTQLCSVPLLLLECITKLTNVIFNLHSKPTTVEEKKEFITRYLSSNLALKTKYEITIERYKYWASDRDITTLIDTPLSNDQYIYKMNRYSLKNAIQNEDIRELFKLQKQEVNPAEHPLPLDAFIESFLIPIAHNYIEQCASKSKPTSQIQITEKLFNGSCTIS